jgi:hypothetical protein
MMIRSCAAALALVAGLFAVSEAGAFFLDDERPPPNGANGLSLNGFSINGFTSDVTVLKAAILQDGSRVVLK